MVRKTFKTTDGRNLREGERQKKDGRYEYRYRDIYGQMRSVYSWRLTISDPQPKGKRQCEALRILEERIKSDLHDNIDTYVAKSVSLNERFDLYLSNKNNLKESTANNYTYMYNRYVRNTLGVQKMCDINTSRMKAFYMSLVTERGFKPATVDNIHTLLNPVFADAVDDNIIRKNPCTKARKDITALSGWTQKDKIKGLTCAQQRLFVDYMLTHKCFERWVNVITVLLGTGMRISELRALCWNDISFETNTIHIKKQLVYRQWNDPDGVKRCYDKVKNLKTTAAERTIPMEPKVRDALIAEKEWQRKLPRRKNEIDGFCDWVFLNRYGLVLKAKSTNNAVDRIINQYNTEEMKKAQEENRSPVLLPHQTNHMLRHSYCNRMIERCCEPNSGMSVKLVQYLMGHEDASTTLDIYTDISEEFVMKTMSSQSGEIYLG